MVGLSIGLLCALIGGVSAWLMFTHISPWIWGIPLAGIYIAGTMFIVARGDRIIMAGQGNHGSHALSNDG